jgi:excisionase family DNA binding protein
MPDLSPAAADAVDAYFLSTTETGRRLGVSRSYVYELINRGEIKTIKVGSRRLVPAGEVDNYAARLIAEIS